MINDIKENILKIIEKREEYLKDINFEQVNNVNFEKQNKK
jgi:hypothetical protein